MQSRIGFHAPHELYPPSELLRFALRAEQAGFGAVTCSDREMERFIDDFGEHVLPSMG